MQSLTQEGLLRYGFAIACIVISRRSERRSVHVLRPNDPDAVPVAQSGGSRDNDRRGRDRKRKREVRSYE